VLVPAHNEAAGIQAMLTSLIEVAPPGCRIVVVADNCTDDTAERARALNVETIERRQPDLRGKGYALAFGREHLAGSAPDVVIVIDADCRFAPGSIERLAGEACATGEPVQALNTLSPDRSATPLVQLSNFAFLVKNAVRAGGLERLGGATLLTGTGMALPWARFAAAPLATRNIVEDLALGLWMARMGARARLLTAARVESASAASGDLREQRKRWEGGFLQMARQAALPTLAAGLARRSRPLIFFGLHLLVPPMAMLLLLSGLAVAALLVAWWWLGAPGLPVAMLGASIALAVILTFLAWLRVGRDTLSARSMLIAPFYVLWKIPIYLGLLTAGPIEWRRTKRESGR
jgi:cellulose synthase/poly-beta-1,6-N-acetylglucosamine synthase-like glycosyltransferase